MKFELKYKNHCISPLACQEGRPTWFFTTDRFRKQTNHQTFTETQPFSRDVFKNTVWFLVPATWEVLCVTEVYKPISAAYLTVSGHKDKL